MGAFKRYQHDIDAFVDSVDRTAKANAVPMGLYYVFFGAQMLFLLPASILLLQKEGDFLSGVLTVILFFLIGQGLKEPLENMMNLVRRIDAILYQPELTAQGSEIPETYDVTYENVSFSYDGERKVLSDINFHASQGMVCGIVGPSGGGKTTFLELLLRFYPLEEGSIRIGGVDIKKIPQQVLMEKIAFVFQESMIFNDTVENNIRMGKKEASLEQIQEAAKAANIHEVIMNLPQGYQTVLGEGNACLSGGEKQRLAIARLFLKDAPILVIRTSRAHERIEEIYEAKPLPENLSGKETLKDKTIRFEQVTFGYGEKDVLEDVSLTFPEKTITALVGPSGSGKSTIARLTGRFWDVEKGQITLGGVSLKDMATETLLSQISMVFQDVYLFHDTIENNIRMGKEEATREEIIEAAKKASCPLWRG